MEKVLLGAGIGLITFALILVGCILGAACGAFSGWIVAMVFVDTFAKLTALTGFAAYQLGAIAGFFGGFVRTIVQKAVT